MYDKKAADRYKADSLSDQQSAKSIEDVDAFELHFRKHAIDPELVSRMYYLPLASLYGAGERPYLPKTLGQALSLFISEAGDAEEARRYPSLFKGVDKSRPLPVVLAPFSSVIPLHKSAENLTTAHPVAFVHNPKDLVAFSVKNLVKYMKFPEVEAREFYKRFKSMTRYKLFMLKKPLPPEDSWNVFTFNRTVDDLVVWRTPQQIRIDVRRHIDNDDIPGLIEQTDMPLPISELATWKAVAAERYERVNEGSSFSQLSAQSQQRHICNTIRHNSAYTELWQEVSKEKLSELHHLAFERLAKRIINQFPYLATEARRQLLELDDGERGW